MATVLLMGVGIPLCVIGGLPELRKQAATPLTSCSASEMSGIGSTTGSSSGHFMIEATAFRWADKTEIRQLAAEAYAVRLLDALCGDAGPAVRQHDGVRVL